MHISKNIRLIYILIMVIGFYMIIQICSISRYRKQSFENMNTTMIYQNDSLIQRKEHKNQ
jgi:hypothetical protein